MRSACSFLGLFLLSAVAVLAGDELPADLREYIDQIKASGMSESAAGNLRMVAAAEAGEMVIVIEKDETGKYIGASYESKFCAKPGLSGELLAKLQEEQKKAEELSLKELERIKKVADLDGSGFISTAEGGQVRDLYFFAKFVQEFASDGVRDGNRIAERSGMPVARFRQKLEAYAGMKGYLFPELPALTFPEAAATLTP
ncbi:MAG TPA: hypothetical protein VE078_13640 [Thermoanaerobaculia bacterium]|nr:hypothetical protein [Thermoanaerobaculia bacterium]